MTRHGEEFKLDQNLMDDIAVYMDDDIREQVHSELAPCEPEKFLKRYLEIKPDFEELLKTEFSIEP